MSSSSPQPAAATDAPLAVATYSIPYGFTGRGTFRGYKDNRHLLTFGPTRSGKGATVIIPALLMVAHSVLCIDPKSQNAAVTARRRRELGQDVFLLNPFDELGLGTAHLNPLARLRIEQPNVVPEVRSLADAMIVPGKDTHWTDSALDLLTALLLYLVATKPGTATLGDMRRLLTQPEDMLHETIRQLVQLWDYPFIREFGARFGSGTKEIQSVVSTANTQTSFLSTPGIANVLSKDDFSIQQLKEKPTTVFIILPAKYIDAYARFFRLLVTHALDALTAKPGGLRTLLILDEAALLQGLSSVSRAFGYAAGYNVQVWPFFQDLPQLKTIYGDRWETFMANAGMVQLFTPGDLTTAEYLMRRGGMTQETRRSLAVNEISNEQWSRGFSGVTQTYSMDKVPLVPIEKSMSMRGSGQIVLFAGLHSPELQGRLEYWRNPRLMEMYDPDPFHS